VEKALSFKFEDITYSLDTQGAYLSTLVTVLAEIQIHL